MNAANTRLMQSCSRSMPAPTARACLRTHHSSAMRRYACSNGKPPSIYHPGKRKPILAMGSRRSDEAGKVHAGNVGMQDVEGNEARPGEAASVSDIADLRGC